MKQLMVLLLSLVLSATFLTGCSGRTLGGAAVGGAAGVGTYEYHMDRQMKRVEEDYKKGKITKEEYEIRKDQIKRDSFFK
jgi:hypothetical protein